MSGDELKDRPLTELTIPVIWDGNTGLSQPIQVRILARNIGTRSAQQAVFNVALPPGFVEEVRSEKGNVTTDNLGNIRMMYPTPYVHPTVSFEMRLTVKVRAGQTEVPIAVGVVSADGYRPSPVALMLNLSD